MSMKNEVVQSKNVKRFYVPKTAIIYFSDQDLTIFNDFSKNIAEYTSFFQIGTTDRRKKMKLNRFNNNFYSWVELKKNEERIMKPSSFFNNIAKEMVNLMKDLDIAIIVYKSNNIDVLEYVDEISAILCKNDVFTYHFVVENFVQSAESKKRFEKIIKGIQKKKQVYVPIKEESVVLAYKNANIATRNYYTNLYINSLIDLYLSPFLDPKRNSDIFSRIKALFYQNKKNFESKVISTLGYSDDKIDNVDLALISALSNPIFAAAFDASNTFIVSVKMPFFLDIHLERIKKILKLVVGEWKQFYVSSYIGSFEYDKYCQISIMAINVDESKLIKDPEKINSYIKKILKNVQTSRELFENNKTKEIILEGKINLLED